VRELFFAREFRFGNEGDRGRILQVFNLNPNKTSAS
jgi:hypothetical protein